MKNSSGLITFLIVIFLVLLFYFIVADMARVGDFDSDPLLGEEDLDIELLAN